MTRQWPDNICSGAIRYAPASNYSGFSLKDAEHGIPTIGAVQVDVFNYPGQTEDIARRLVAAWNAAIGTSTEDLEAQSKEIL